MNLLASNWELGNAARQLEPRREQVSGYPVITRVSTDDGSRCGGVNPAQQFYLDKKLAQKVSFSY